VIFLILLFLPGLNFFFFLIYKSEIGIGAKIYEQFVFTCTVRNPKLEDQRDHKLHFM
jgi:hypothetical protein